MTDQELLELAAKAAGIEIVSWFGDCPEILGKFSSGQTYIDEWNPLTNSEDALNLVVKVGIDVNHYPNSQEVGAIKHGIATRCIEKYKDDSCAATATRRAIVRAAAEIGKQKE
jgi:hypothetical protein